MKRKTILFFCLLAMQLLCTAANAAIIDSGKCGENVNYTLSDNGTLEIIGTGDMYNWKWNTFPWYSKKELVITVNIGDGVTSIGSYAFYECSGLTSVTLGNSVTSIGSYAFYNCSGLTTITIPNSVTSIGSYAFYNCSGLTTITIPNSVTSIGSYVFGCCYGLISVTIPNSVTSIGGWAFCYCSGLTSITIPNSVTSIGEYAFLSCRGLTSITIPNSVTSIGKQAFLGCEGLISFEVDKDNPNYIAIDNVLYNKNKTELIFCIENKTGTYTIPNSVTKIGDYALNDCSGLTSITIPNSVTSIGSNAFSGCTGLTSITIPNSVMSIGDFAFSGCSGLTSITIPNSVVSIGGGAFATCSGLTSVTTPNSVTSIGNGAFAYCFAIKKIYWNSNISYSFDSYVEEIYYGDDVTIVYPLVSSSKIYSLNKVVLGKNVEYIRQYAFNGANLKEFYITGEKEPYLYSDVFTNVTLSNCTLYVPSTKTGYYQTTEPWKNFGKILTLEGGDPGYVQKQCAKPNIAYENAKLYYSTATPQAKVYSTVSVEDAKSSVGTEVGLTATYEITAIAKRDGYLDSEPAYATLHWINGTLDSSDGIKSVGTKRAILISSSDGFITVSGLNDGEKVALYSIDGKGLGSARAAGDAALLSAKTGETVIIKIGNDRIKTIVK